MHRQLPEGGVLVFMTGQAEILDLCRRLRERFPGPSGKRKADQRGKKQTTAKKDQQYRAKKSAGGMKSKETASGQSHDSDEEAAVDLDDLQSDDDEHFAGENEDVSPGSEDDGAQPAAEAGLYVLPLYSTLPAAEQARVSGVNLEHGFACYHVSIVLLFLQNTQVFAAIPANKRLCVVATNVAETSITIPGIRYVVDTGLVHLDFGSWAICLSLAASVLNP